jgi:hypothetical protein
MPASPHDFAEDEVDAQFDPYPHVGRVTSAPPKTDDDPWTIVRVNGITFDGEVPAYVLHGVVSDVHVPAEGTRVSVQFTNREQAYVVGQLPDPSDTLPTYEPGDRIVAPQTAASQLRMDGDGTVTIESDGTITIDAAGNDVDVQNASSVSVNGGSTGVVTDASVSTTTDGDGHVTSVSVSVTRSSDLYVP